MTRPQKRKTKKRVSALNEKGIPILISGIVGSGKSTLGKKLAKVYGYAYVSASEIHKEIITKQLGLNKSREIKKGFWETEDGDKGVSLRAKQLSIDQEVDIRLLEMITKNPRMVTDARLMPWLYPHAAVRIWMSVSPAEAVRRISVRDSLPPKMVSEKITKRLNTDTRIFKKLYGIRYGTDLSVFDLVIQTDGFSVKETYAIVKRYIDAHFRAGQTMAK